MIGNVGSNDDLSLLRAFRKNRADEERSLTRLASGKRINTGADDPAGLISSEQLSAAIASLEAESRSIERANSNAAITDGRVAQVSTMLNDVKALQVASANTGGMSDAEIEANQMQIDSIVASARRFIGDTVSSLDGFKMADGGNAALEDKLNTVATTLASFATGGANSLASGNFEQASTALGAAVTNISEVRGTIGAYQKHTLEPRLNSSAIERENLLSARSEIVDTDYAVETARLAQAKIRTTSTVALLRISRQNSLRVLDLLS